MTMNCRYTCISLYKLEYSIPEEKELQSSRKSKYVTCESQKYDNKFPKTENTRKQM